jgi:hypothetical protein
MGPTLRGSDNFTNDFPIGKYLLSLLSAILSYPGVFLHSDPLNSYPITIGVRITHMTS